MRYLDVLFPLNLPRLTYICPSSLEETALPGTVVSAPLRKSITRGLVVARHDRSPGGTIKEIVCVHGDQPAVGSSLIALMTWMADYYLAPEGVVLKYTIPAELFGPVKSRKSSRSRTSADSPPFPIVPDEYLSPLLSSLKSNKYETVLLHAPTQEFGYAAALRIMEQSRGIVALFPEVSRGDRFFSMVNAYFPERAALLHGALPRGTRSDSVGGILSGRFDIVVGTRPALFSPLKNITNIIVFDEEAHGHKIDEGFRFSVRDTAVMRGFFEKSAVLLASTAPSVESTFNVMTKKYRLFRPAGEYPRPRIRIVNSKVEKNVEAGITKTVFTAARRIIEEGKPVLFLINRTGYAPLLACAECGHCETCDACKVPMPFHKKDRKLSCRYCGGSRPVPERCSKCGGTRLEPAGTGTERIQEAIASLYKVAALRFDRETARGRTAISELLSRLPEESAQVVVGTKKITSRAGSGEKFAMAAVMNADAGFNIPDFRAIEKTYHYLSSVLEHVVPEGAVYIQTRFPELQVFRHVRTGSHDSFVKEELSQRKAFGYPPYFRLVSLRCKENTSLMRRAIIKTEAASPGLEVLGPANVRDRRGRALQEVLLKHRDRKALHAAAREFIRIMKDSKWKVEIDVDPY